ncbi:MAG: hypothetical protein NZ553_08670 [Caldilinea sp.]|nr:hypothetical protein [Caldilinea sp.]MDW8440530.1 hypothetical protein [Caldilineaceae bacterium]
MPPAAPADHEKAAAMAIAAALYVRRQSQAGQTAQQRVNRNLTFEAGKRSAKPVMLS